MAWMWLWGLLGLGLLILLVWAIARTAASGGPSLESPETVLKRRYAAGEIDREEYERRLADIRK